MTAPTILFDLDGTLLDTAMDLMRSLNHVLAEDGLEPVAYADMTWLVGQGARAMIEKAHGLRGHRVTEERLNQLMQVFLAHYAEGMPGETQLFPGLEAALDRLAGAGMRLAVCTNKSESLAVRLLERMGLASRFVAITGGDTFAVRKPHGDHVALTIDRAGGDRTRAVMIGDSINDILAGQAAGVPTIAVPFGYSDKPVETFGPDAIVSHFDELDEALIARLLDRKVHDTAQAG